MLLYLLVLLTMSETTPQSVQSALYDFPYHHLPHEREGAWYLGRHYHFGFEYLSLLEHVTEMTRLIVPKSILDFGCGDARLLHELRRCLGTHVELYGIDIDKRALLFAQAFSTGDSLRLTNQWEELEDKQFNLVIASEVLEHIPTAELGTVVEQLARHVSDDGSLLVSVPTHNLPLIPKHFRHFRLNELQKVLEPHFKLSSYRYLNRISLLGRILTRATSNRFFVVRWSPWLKAMRHLYQHLVTPADVSNASRLIAVLKKKSC